jgi:hypothetical protein
MMKRSHSLRKHISIFPLIVIALFAVACGTLEVGIEPDVKVGDANAQSTGILPTEHSGADPRRMTPTPVPEDYTPPTPVPAFTPVQPDAYPAPPGLRVAFVKEGNIWLWTAESRKAVPLTTRGEVVGDIRISDDGALVAFRSGGDGRLWSVSSDGTGERQLLNAGDLEAMESEGVEATLHHFDWVPGTHVLAFNTRLRRESGDVPADDLHLADADTMEHTSVLAPGEGGAFHYSPDGSQIAIVTAGDISLIDADGGSRRDSVLTYAPVAMYSGSDYYVQPTWSADGRSLLVAVPPADPHARPTQHTTIWRIPTDGAAATLVTSIAAFPGEGSAAFSHELNFMAYAELPKLSLGATPPTRTQAWLKVVRLENGDWFGYSYSGMLYGWAPRSRRFAFLADVGDRTPQFQIGEWSSGTVPGSVDAGTPVHDVRWVDADHYLLVAGRGQDRYDLLLGDVDRGSAILVTVDGALPAYDFANAGPPVRDRMPTPTMEPTPSPTAEPTSTPTQGSSSLSVIFIGDDNIWMWTERFGAVTLTLSGGVAGAKIADDGAVVAYRRQMDDHQTELWAVNSDGSEARRLVSADDLSAIDPSALAVDIHDFEWVPGSHTVAFNTRKVAEGPGLMPYDDLRLVEADTLEQAALLSPGEGGDFHYSADGRQVAIVSPQQISLMDADGGNRRDVLAYSPVTTYSEVRFYARPVWAMDSRSLGVAIPPTDPLAQPSQPTGIWHIPTDERPASLLSEIHAEALNGRHLAVSPDLSRVAYVAQPEGALPRAETGPLFITDLRSGETVTYHPHVHEIYGWAPDSERFSFLGDGERPKAQIGQLGTGPFPAHSGDYAVVLDVYWIDAEHYLFSARRDDQGWDIVLAEVGGSSRVLATVTGRPPPIMDIAASAAPRGWVSFPYRYADAGNFSLQAGDMITMTWSDAPLGGDRYEFVTRPTGDSTAATVIGSDRDPSDGVAITWSVPEQVSADLRAVAYLPGGRVLLSNWSAIYSGSAPPEGVCTASSATIGALALFTGPEFGSGGVGHIPPGTYAQVAERTDHWYRVDASQSDLEGMAQSGWVRAEDAVLHGACDDVSFVYPTSR